MELTGTQPLIYIRDWIEHLRQIFEAGTLTYIELDCGVLVF